MNNPPTIELTCPRCGQKRACLRTNGPHLEALCGACQRHIKFVSKAQYGHLMTDESQPIPPQGRANFIRLLA